MTTYGVDFILGEVGSQRDEIVENILYPAIDQANKTLPEEKNIAKSVEALLFGSGGPLSSLGLVRLVAAVEENIQTHFGRSVRLASRAAMSRAQSPFQNVSALAEYIEDLLTKN